MGKTEETWSFAVVGRDSNEVPAYFGVAKHLEEVEKLRQCAKMLGWRSVAVLDSTKGDRPA